MFTILVSMLIAGASAPGAPQDRLFEEAHGWRVLSNSDGCVGFFKQPGSLSVSVFYPKTRDGLIFIVHHGNVPALSDTRQMVLARAGKTQWGPVEAKAYAQSEGLPGVMFDVQRPKALAEFGKADSITLTKRFAPPRTIPLVAADKGADMLARCVG